MAEQIRYQQSIPAYSGITINITNPNMNTAPVNGCCGIPASCSNTSNSAPQLQTEYVTYPQNQVTPSGYYAQAEISGNVADKAYRDKNDIQNSDNAARYANSSQQSYPAEYYMSNYNVQNINPAYRDFASEGTQSDAEIRDYYSPNAKYAAATPIDNEGASSQPYYDELQSYEKNKDMANETNNLQTSQEIIENIELQDAEEKELQKNGKKVKVVTLTNEYIMSLENSLNNPNADIRLMAAKDILTRLDEDHDRYNDAALNALINKMLQDPAKLVRVAALSALSSNLASGNDYTIELLNRIQQDPNADRQDVLDAAQILLNRSASTEIRYIPTENNQQ